MNRTTSYSPDRQKRHKYRLFSQACTQAGINQRADLTRVDESTIVFRGRVVPGTPVRSIDNPCTITHFFSDIGREICFTLNIQHNVIEVSCKSEKILPDEINDVFRLRALYVVQAFVSLGAFASGKGAVAFLDRYSLNDGAEFPIADYAPFLSRICTVYKVNHHSERHKPLLNIVLQEPKLAQALDDLAMCLARPYLAAINTARAIEALRNLVAPGEMPAVQWAKLQASLRVTKDYLALITSASRGPRHGAASELSLDIHLEAMDRTWKVMNRYLEMRLLRSNGLPDSYPILDQNAVGSVRMES